MDQSLNLKLHQRGANSTNTSIISDNPKMQIYYKKNIKQKWNLDIDVNTTQTPKKVYKYAIVPSEFSKDRITKLINEHKFQIINFFVSLIY